jgi:hypothetical protein
MKRHHILAAVAGWTMVAGNTMAADNAPGGNWVRIFADEDWYRQQAGEKRVFVGTLEAVKPPELSTLMRQALYRLGDRTIYTAARKHPSLDAFVGKEVNLLGKAVDMELEGQSVREIWPESIRAEANPAARPATTMPPKQEDAPPARFDASAAEKLARDFLTREQVQVVSLKAFRLPPSAEGWWMVEYRAPNRPVVSPGPTVFVNEKTGEVTRQAPKGTPARL